MTAKPDFLFFGAGDASYYEQASIVVAFEKAPTASQRRKVEAGLPKPLGASRWSKRCLLAVTEDYAFTGKRSFRRFNESIERWLHASHTLVPIDFALRAEDAEAGGTRLSTWHQASLRGALTLLKNLATRYDDAETRDFVRETLVEMMKDAGLVVPAALDRGASWRAALDAGDAARLAPHLVYGAHPWPEHLDELKRVLDPQNPQHRRAMLGARLPLEVTGPFDTDLFSMALVDGDARVVDLMLARAASTPFWATACAAAAGRLACRGSAPAFAALDRLVGLSTSHPVVIEEALNAALEAGAATVPRERLDRYGSLAVARLGEWPALHPYLVKLAPVLGQEAPARTAPAKTRRRR